MADEERENVTEETKKKGPMEYVIVDKTYIQKPLVLGQIKQLTKLLKGIQWPQKLDIVEIVEALTDVLPQGLAIVLIEKGKESAKELKTRDLTATQEEFEYGVDSELIIKVINDFLSCNPINSMWSLMRGVITTTYTNPTRQTGTQETGLTSSLSTSQEETSLEETKSSGDTP